MELLLAPAGTGGHPAGEGILCRRRGSATLTGTRRAASRLLASVSAWGQNRTVATLKVSSLGDYLREQRRNAELSLRQLAEAAGVSNPYLSQIERGLRKPSAEILQQIAKALRISAEQLYVQAGILEEREGGQQVVATILTDTSITERQKRVLIDIYESFRKGNAAPPDQDAGSQSDGNEQRPPQ